MTGNGSKDDEVFLDGLFDRALREWSSGRRFDAEEAATGRPELRDRIAAALRLARSVAVYDPPEFPAIPGFEVLAEIGEGAMGTVWLARQLSLGRRVALKVLAPSAALSASARDRFQREAEALAAIQHPHVVAVHEVIEVEGAPVLVMEWVEGRPLSRVLAEMRQAGRPPAGEDLWRAIGAEGPPPEGLSAVSWVGRLGIAMARALGEVHRAGLLHRDVKPSNILLRRDGTPLLGDFGLARGEDEIRLTQSGSFLGTPAYAAPEQIRGEWARLDARTDVHALGVTLYEALALDLPHRARSTAALLAAIEQGRAVPLRRKNPAVPRDLETVVHLAMDPDPARRYPSADALADDLERILRFEPIRARRAGPLLRAGRFLRRNRRAALAAVAAGSIAILLTVLAISWSGEGARREARAAEHLRRARLALLDGSRSTAPCAPAALAEALREYEAMAGLGPVPEDARIEAELVRTAGLPPRECAAALAGGTRAACPLLLSVLGSWPAIGPPPLLSPEVLSRATRADRRALGFAAWLRDEWTLCATAFAPLDLNVASDPFVDGVVGRLHLELGAPDRAFARLLRAFEAFPESARLAFDVARAAAARDDTTAAWRFLQKARDLGLEERIEGLDHVLAEIRKDRADDGTGAYEGWLQNLEREPGFFRHESRSASRRGDREDAVRHALQACVKDPEAPENSDLLVEAVEAWWAGLGPKDRLRAVVISLRSLGTETDALHAAARILRRLRVPDSSTPAGTVASQDLGRAPLRDSPFLLEVLAMPRSLTARLPIAWIRAAEAACLSLDDRLRSAGPGRSAAARAVLSAAVLSLLALPLPGQSCLDNWIQAAPATQPPARSYPSMTFDSGRNLSVLFGGSPDSGPQFNDTWEYDGIDWTLNPTSSSPPARGAGGFAYDPVRGVCVLFGGYSPVTGYMNDTWEYDGVNWTAVPGSGPSPREGGRMAFDAWMGKILLAGGTTASGSITYGDTWTYDATGWTQMWPDDPAIATFYAGLAYDSARGRTVLYRGVGAAVPHGEIWEWNGFAWAYISTAYGPGRRASTAFAFDTARGRCVLFGGASGPPYAYYSDTWEWDGTAWSQRSVSGPLTRYAPGSAYDLQRRTLVMFGGQGIPGPSLNDTWDLPSGVNNILTPPAASEVLGAGQTLSLSVAAAGQAPLSYQWRKNTVPLADGGSVSGAQSPGLSISGVVPGDSGSYDVVVSGPCGAVLSPASAVTVHPVLLAFTQFGGPGSVEVTNHSDLAAKAYFTAFSFHPLNAISPGTGIFLGLHITLQYLVTMYLIGVPPFGGLLDPLGDSLWALSAGTLSPVAGLSVWGVTHTYDPLTLLPTGNSPIAHLVIQ